jgi:hypothetical protein
VETYYKLSIISSIGENFNFITMCFMLKSLISASQCTHFRLHTSQSCSKAVSQTQPRQNKRICLQQVCWPFRGLMLAQDGVGQIVSIWERLLGAGSQVFWFLLASLDNQSSGPCVNRGLIIETVMSILIYQHSKFGCQWWML